MGCGVPSPRALKALGETVVHAKGDRWLSGGPSQRGAQHGGVSPRLWVSSAQLGLLSCPPCRGLTVGRVGGGLLPCLCVTRVPLETHRWLSGKWPFSFPSQSICP